MKILFSSRTFYPNIGGLETVSMILAHEFSRAGNQVVVITGTPAAEDEQEFPFTLMRRPGARELLRLTAWADIVFHNNLSLRSAWSLLFVRRPWVVAHHIWLPRGYNLRGAKAAFKRLVLRKAEGVAISRAIADDFGTPSRMISNPYDDEAFRVLPGIERDQDLVFVGRFVSDKGLPVLLQAMKLLAQRGLRLGLSVVGTGPENEAWRELVQRSGLSAQVHFAGEKRGRELAEVLNAHKVLVVPSLWREPFGIVALEGMACGCLVVGSEGGGLKEAIGPAGLTFPNGDASALAGTIERAVRDEPTANRCRLAAPAHLEQHRPTKVAAGYLAMFNVVLSKTNSAWVA